MDKKRLTKNDNIRIFLLTIFEAFCNQWVMFNKSINLCALKLNSYQEFDNSFHLHRSIHCYNYLLQLFFLQQTVMMHIHVMLFEL